MKPLTLLLFLLAFGLAGCAQDAVAQEARSPSTEPESLARRKLDYYRDRVRQQRLFWADAPDRPFEMVEEPLIRFENPVSRISDAMLFVWTDRGRPVVAMKCYHNEPNKTWGRTFVSLGTDKIALEIDGTKAWYPVAAGIEFAPLPNAPPPASQPAQRLSQMRQLAAQFEIIDHWGKQNPTDWNLRLLSTPLYRYVSESHQVVDGALFGYVITTGPEALVLLEARQTDAGLEWHYAMSRMTVFALKFSRGGRQIAEFPRLEEWPPTGTYFHLAVPFGPDPFAEEGAPSR
jgi:hypothetical protein